MAHLKIEEIYIAGSMLFVLEEKKSITDISDKLLEFLGNLLIPLAIILAIVLFLLLNRWLFNRSQFLPQTKKTFKILVAIAIIFIGMFAFIFSLEIADEKQMEIVKFLAVLLSAAIALSSTTVLGNLIAGVMNNSIKRFRNGDLIKIGDLHGRVTNKRFFHTEIQLEDSNFVTVPNLFVATHPVILNKKSNTIISTSVSLGYDVSRTSIEDCLLKAAKATGLNNPYVYITHLGDYSVVYKVHGFLEDSSKYLSTTSLLNANVLDELHGAKIEIVSPSFMYQKRVDQQKFIPKAQVEKTIEKVKSPEELIFAEAIKSEEIEKKKDHLVQINKKIEAFKEKIKRLEDEEEIEKAKLNIKRLEEYKVKMDQSIQEQIKKNEG
ncbi:mechanosensitive ion channel family protein [Muriicola sp. Z0-33]|uniref:mechanosensitive ion channel family protein n=1 Tax=Muriicola sp. Z0-33 TaxID=2816957 RepID=UPI0022382BE2|nr:mechanosensitive ion channel domain-containing protein [Muriicola sp. Z0-33]MCW5517337.1 mechanosensitive ion channel [Muriicola sp. Z0-33]